MGFSERLAQAMESAGYTQGRLAKEVDMAQSSVNKLLKNAKGSRKTVEIASVLGVRPEWLSTGEGEMVAGGAREPTALYQVKPSLNGIYRVDVLDVKASAGPGTLVTSDFIETIRAIEYTTEQARALFGNRPATHVKVITVNGDSMDGTISPGDQIFVDTGVTHFDGDGVYVFVFGKTLHVKRLQMQRDRLAVISDNPIYEKWYVEPEDEDAFYVMAKVLLRQSVDYKRFA
ncbi:MULTISPECIES: helix-turn-helix transcriptional regulator [Enterobacter]|uniref:LexA family transcriptional regulator n=1 Tax=Enterobacter TaxID=547 RepID=UPI001C1CA58C|nr:helix-turn-helix transcriptional regulator [Enterobacter hormaechei]HAV1593816.1 helix-turn-helix transcriptional regulator [Enterobacter hormaechei subsp. xiangfangensis]MDZ5680938.1 helix-turn-helix transcriptional regulator [Enterobacter hormaechei]WLP13644.1 helix-turn-helix transcriptional regulator [Enterobacter hormaechei]HAV1671135.1 helix-turn-helix transcriptional regulator [Enterobacter hormaechei subsp. xiangfangensis]HAV2003100.1 helix-turn-helix transcriptional regulator [Ente